MERGAHKHEGDGDPGAALPKDACSAQAPGEREFLRAVRGRFPLEVTVNVVGLTVLMLVAMARSSVAPSPTLDPRGHDHAARAELAALEEAWGSGNATASTADTLASRYLALGKPGLAARVLLATPDVARDPRLLHRLAAAYAHLGRAQDGLLTARTARRLCERPSLEAADAGGGVACSARLAVAIETQEQALEHAVVLGVTLPGDPKLATAYRRARIAARVARLP